MAFKFTLPFSTNIPDDSFAFANTEPKGTNFSLFGIGGYMEVWSTDDLKFTVDGTNDIKLSGNTIPIEYYKGPVSAIPNRLTLEGDGISSGRRKLGMLAYVHETDQVYQYVIPDYENLWQDAEDEGWIQANANDGQIISYTVRSKPTDNSYSAATAFVNAWLDNSIEGVSQSRSC